MIYDSDRELKAGKAVALQSERLRELCEVARRVTRGLVLDDQSHFAFMGACFLAKQLEHARAVLALGSHPDTGSITRAMLEGMWQLKWASIDLEERPKRWREFCHIHDWRLLRAMDARGESVSESDRRDILAAVASVGENYLTVKAKKQRSCGRPLADDPYVRSWHDLSVRQLAVDTEELSLYESKYSELSDRLHWGLDSFGRALDASDGSLRYDVTSVYITVIATTLSFRCVADTALSVSRTLNLTQRPEIETLVHRFVSDGIEYGMLPKPRTERLHALRSQL